MAAVVQAVVEVRRVLGVPPVVVGGLAVLCRLTDPYRATTDLDLVDRRRGPVPHLRVLRAVDGAEEAVPAAVLLPTRFGPVRVDVLEVRQTEIDRPSSDPGDRLHATAHAWADASATSVGLRAVPRTGDEVRTTALVAEPGPLVAMKLQAVMDRSSAKRGTDLQDVVRLLLDGSTRDRALDQIGTCEATTAADIALHVEHWLVRERADALRWIRASAGSDIEMDDVDLVAELLLAACAR
ncbi:prevent-host-death protein [Cellulomonas triticagri]|uniref:Prevent-host-death protein n=1 Tax=Cellulomonas triticagri TaxID=2483352 RepID=A0A3M2JM88_9CELL|nr:prevent-host-death protein [Cellulomonas triticagri]RMI12703.1 prevent-host-death protein [Cellulomonas triticagri]